MRLTRDSRSGRRTRSQVGAVRHRGLARDWQESRRSSTAHDGMTQLRRTLACHRTVAPRPLTRQHKAFGLASACTSSHRHHRLGTVRPPRARWLCVGSTSWHPRSSAPAGMISREGRLASVPPRLTHWGDGVRRAISIVVTVLLAVSVVSTVVVWTEGSSKKPLQVVRGAIGAETGRAQRRRRRSHDSFSPPAPIRDPHDRGADDHEPPT